MIMLVSVPPHMESWKSIDSLYPLPRESAMLIAISTTKDENMFALASERSSFSHWCCEPERESEPAT